MVLKSYPWFSLPMINELGTGVTITYDFNTETYELIKKKIENQVIGYGNSSGYMVLGTYDFDSGSDICMESISSEDMDELFWK